MDNPKPKRRGPSIDGGWLSSLGQAHFDDYNAPALRLWVATTLGGALAIAFAVAVLSQRSASEHWQILGWVAIAGFAAAFPIHVPRTKYAIAVGDLVLYLLLALHGMPAAVIGAAVEGLVASLRSSKRLTSRVATPSAAAAGMFIAGVTFEAIQPSLVLFGLPTASVYMGALVLAALMHQAISTALLMQIVCLKNDRRLTLGDWVNHAGWAGTFYLLSAVMAGALSLTSQQSGASTAAVGLVVIGLSLVLLHRHFNKQQAQHLAQEARVAAAESEAKQNQKRFHSAFTHASIGMAIVSSNGIVLQVNEAFCSLFGYDADVLVQKPFADILRPADATVLERRVARVIARQDDSFSVDLRCVGLNQREIWVSLHCALFDDDVTEDAGLIFQLHDITSRHRAEGELQHIAYHDGLTDLANRHCFLERLSVAVERTRTDRRFKFAVIYLDLDHFKMINDSFGHPAGDELLKEVARRLGRCFRPGDLVARLGGDEFAVLLEDVQHHDDVIRLAKRVLRTLEAPVLVNSTEARTQASIGITFSDLGYREPDEILRDADIAMYKAKADGRGRLALFDASLHDQIVNKLQLEADLRRAIGEGGLGLVFQPMFELKGIRLAGFEALIRWTHPARGAVAPHEFVLLAEEIGCIEALTAWVVDEAVAQLASWRNQWPDLGSAVMHVNVSGFDLSNPRFPMHVRKALQRHLLPAQHLVIEITEGALMEQRDIALRSLAELRGLGVKVSIDDFGTGYSSLAYLSTLPFDCMKIDRMFLLGMDNNPTNVEIVKTILSLAQALNKLAIAEGVETKDQLRRLTELGMPWGQGFLLGRPFVAHEAQGRLFKPPIKLGDFVSAPAAKNGEH